MNQELPLTLKHIAIIWFMGFTTGVPFMGLVLSIKYQGSVIIPILNFLIMSGISAYGFMVFKKKKAKSK